MRSRYAWPIGSASAADAGLSALADLLMTDLERAMGDELVAWGKVLLLETRGRVTGLARTTPVGFVEDADRCLLVVATDEWTDWARNLMADPRCRATLEDTTAAYQAEPLEAPAHDDAVRALILKYGTPAERLGAGPAFRLRPRSTSSS